MAQEATHSIEWVTYNITSNEHFQEARIGKDDVTSIGQHEPRGPGDVWYYDIIKKDNSFVRIFNVGQVGYSRPMSVLPVKSKLIT